MVTSDAVVASAKKYAPWAAPWWVALVQGLVALGLGALILYYKEQASTVVGQFLALYLLIHGLFELTAGAAAPRSTMAAQIAFYRGVFGAVVGGFLISLIFLQVLTPQTGLLWLSIGLLVYGVGGLYLAFARQHGNGRLLSIIGGALFAVLGAFGLFGRNLAGNPLSNWVGWTLVILGVGLVVMAFVRRSNAASAAEEAAAAAAAKK